MNQPFNDLINSFIENKVGIAANFLSTSLVANLKENLTNLYSTNQLLAAGIGNAANIVPNKSFRSDAIYWLDRKHNNKHENEFFDLMDQFVSHLNSTCYTGISSYEFHYTLYGKGDFYKRHLDQFKNNDSRQFSMIMYLNHNWQQEDGGELCIYHETGEQRISPEHGKSVFFKSSELEHEVLLVQKPRMSITGWLKR